MRLKKTLYLLFSVALIFLLSACSNVTEYYREDSVYTPARTGYERRTHHRSLTPRAERRTPEIREIDAPRARTQRSITPTTAGATITPAPRTGANPVPAPPSHSDIPQEPLQARQYYASAPPKPLPPPQPPTATPQPQTPGTQTSAPAIPKAQTSTSAPEASVTPKPSAPETTQPKPQPTPATQAENQQPKSHAAGRQLASHKTEFSTKEDARTTNITNASNSINGTVVQPGEKFSYNKTVGPTIERRGYKESTIYVDGEKKKGFGGGVCQVSTTLSIAADNAGMTIMERHDHSLPVTYAKEGEEAATSYGVLDFEFKNEKDFAIVIHSTVEGGTITVTISEA